MKFISTLFLFLFFVTSYAQSSLYMVADSVSFSGQPALAFFFPSAGAEKGMELWEDHISDFASGKPKETGTQLQIEGVSFEKPLEGPYVSTSDFVQQRDGLYVFFVFEDSTGIVTEPSNPQYWILEKRLLEFVSEILTEQLETQKEEQENLLEENEDEVKSYTKEREKLLEDIQENRAEIRKKEQNISIEKNMQERIVVQIEGAKAQLAKAQSKEERKPIKKNLEDHVDQLEDSQKDEKEYREDIFDLESEIREWEAAIGLAGENANYYTLKAEQNRTELLRIEELIYEASQMKKR